MLAMFMAGGSSIPRKRMVGGARQVACAMDGAISASDPQLSSAWLNSAPET
jgi:hypothetical protein